MSTAANSARSVRGTRESTIMRAVRATMFGKNISRFFMRLFSSSFDFFVIGQLSVVSCQLSVVSCQLSVVSCQLSVVSCQLSVVSKYVLVALEVRFQQSLADGP